ncbi:SMP-30/gluconolactonase/LRE family protein [Chitinophaga silvatica]|uniref:SMP-30/gluconolactonase/LRE family protein n=1 Tax=Chitinophaga silvatica TaxID=2282649 RepID=A0A3E1YBC4_9BACT|nr:SMP-30/gluconolactonase/LRE family protein [Chitinophaga silvatica]RFS23289.1 SMP-30/gluconolactonase/LRE family protein [Chitinophaga silvatica]
MTKQLYLAILLLSCATTVLAQNKELYKAKDLTSENQFSSNIEGPNFDKTGNLYIVNFQHDGTIGKINPTTGAGEIFVTLPDGSVANGVHFNSKSTMLLPDFKGHNVLAVDMKTKQVSVYVYSNQFNQPNDLCINRKDQIFASDPKWASNSGQIWRIDTNRIPVLLETDMGTTNGIELSPNEKILYVNESVQRKIWKYEVDEKGNISNKQLFAEFPDFGFDGMKCDKAGNLYVARWGKGVIAVLTPDGKLLREIPLKGKQCSNLVFGGKDGKTVFVTLQDRKAVETFRVAIAGKKF